MADLSIFKNIADMEIKNDKGVIKIEYGNGIYAEFRKIPINILMIDPKYQRRCDSNHVMKIINKFATVLVNPLKLVKRNDGNYYIFDGQHTWRAIEKLVEDNGLPEDFGVLCMIYYNIDYATECKLFSEQTGESIKVSNTQKLNALIQGKDEQALEFNEITNNNGFKIPTCRITSLKKDCISSFTLFWNYYLHNGPEKYDRLLKLLRNTWDGVKESMSAPFIKGFITLLTNMVHNPDVKVNLLQIDRKKKIVSDINDDTLLRKLNPKKYELLEKYKGYFKDNNDENIENEETENVKILKQNIIELCIGHSEDSMRKLKKLHNAIIDNNEKKGKTISVDRAYALAIIQLYNEDLKGLNRLNEEKLPKSRYRKEEDIDYEENKD